MAGKEGASHKASSGPGGWAKSKAQVCSSKLLLTAQAIPQAKQDLLKTKAPKVMLHINPKKLVIIKHGEILDLPDTRLGQTRHRTV